MITIERLITAGVFSLDGQDFDVENNVWILGDENQVVVIDAAHDSAAIQRAIGDRTLSAIICTHAHNDHINAAVALAQATGAPIRLHPDDTMLWEAVYPDRPVDGPLTDGETLREGSVELQVLHTPGHSPGSCCLYVSQLGAVFTGDTLFNGGPGATGRSFSSYDDILDSIETRLFTLPAETVVNTGHGEATSIGIEAKSLPEWRSRQI